MSARGLGHLGQCEVVDIVPTEDDAEFVRCHRLGRVIEERVDERVRWRCVCPTHSEEQPN